MKKLPKYLNIFKIKDLSLIFLSVFIFFSSILYWFSHFSFSLLVISIFLTIISLIILNKYNLLPPRDQLKPKFNQFNKKINLLLLAFFLFFGAAILELITSATSESLISPWEVVSAHFFFFYGLSLISLFFIIKENVLTEKTNLWLISFHLFLSLSVTLLVYRLGYGFDPFIHQGAMEMIAQEGVINPKTPYYLGQYNLIVSLNYLTGLSIAFLNKILVPFIAALLLPPTIANLLRKIIDHSTKKRELIINYGTLIASAFSFSLFIVTTPQNLSYLFLIIAIFSGLEEKKPTKTLIFALATTAIHPISGIPALIWSGWLLFKAHKHRFNTKGQKIISTTLLYLGAIIIPLALFISSGAKIANLKFSLNQIFSPLNNVLSYKYAGSEDWLLNITYLLFNNYSLLFLLLIVSGIIIFQKNNGNLRASNLENYHWQGLLNVNISLIIAYVLSTQINFPDLINYEQGDFARRILIIILLFLSPFALITISSLVKRIIQSPKKTLKLWFTILTIFFISASLYLAYPRFDKYYNSRGYSTSYKDIEAVKTVAKLAQDKKYIVLANQQVSAAALKTFGFSNYYPSEHGPIFFYPIPTGGVLYQYYLEMVYKNPSRETMQEAMTLVGAQEGYLIINSYWNDSDKIIKAAKLSADAYFEIGDKDIFIFQYKNY
ncbi:MAG: hypothetical protein PWQ35_505 [Patescibacteria group bacterium]|nr:hypothetical protein [Patescibacteria group bacterium]